MPKPYVVKNAQLKPQRQIHFDPVRISAGIAFHIVDSEIAKSVDSRSIERTRDRLRAANVRLSISAEDWEPMSNESRLMWLLSASKCSIISSKLTAFVRVDRDDANLKAR